METQEANIVAVKRPALTPKAVIHQKYGSKACYRIEEVQQFLDNACPGLVIPHQARCLYRCSLDLPDLSVTSDIFAKKKDAEQSAAKIAMEKLGIQSVTKNLTSQEALDELVARMSGLFTDEFLSSSHPLTGHFRAALSKVGSKFGWIPISLIAACDAKVNNLCRIINPKAESDPLLLVSLIMKAAKMSESIITSNEGLWISRRGSYSDVVLQSLTGCNSCEMGNAHLVVLHLPCSLEEHPKSLTLDLTHNQYYIDIIAQELGGIDSSHVLISRTVGKASSEMKLYFSLPDALDLSAVEENANLDQLLNKKASYLSGQRIYGDAILANVGFTWNSSDLFHEDISPCTYYRMLLNKLPDGHYKLSREAILAAELPDRYSSRSNWKGPLPRELLCVFCRQHRLSEPLFSVKCLDSPENPAELVQTCKKYKSLMLADGEEMKKREADHLTKRVQERSSSFRCEVKILSRRGDAIIEYSAADSHRKEVDAIQTASLKVLTLFNEYFKLLDMPMERLCSLGEACNIHIHPIHFSLEFADCQLVYGANQDSCLRSCIPGGPIYNYILDKRQENGIVLFNPDGPDSGVLSPGCLVCINYTVALVKKGESLKQTIESKDEFEFEIGTGSVIPWLEVCVAQLSINQSAEFTTAIPSRDLILASFDKSSILISQLSTDDYFLEFFVKLLQVTEPLEDRLEQALFSPPLSKQRVDFAVRYIHQNTATSLVDFGCGSGSLLDSLLGHSTTLEKIVGIDISVKGLTRAAKILHSKLNINSSSIQSAVLYDGSITDFDSRLYDFDIGTCLEVIEHMEEDQAHLFGDVVLSLFCPRLLIVSTPNYEYNTILQKSAFPSKEDDPEEKSAPCKFRNYDHKFEWTREQFQQWAGDLASKHKYSVEFSGVGGSGYIEPGFASQIAVFRRSASHIAEKCNEESLHPFKVVWEWPSKHLVT